MAQVVNCGPLTLGAQVSPCGICGVDSGAGTGFSLSSSVFLCRYEFTMAVHTHSLPRGEE
jgi:hypothetical protein